MTTLFPLEATLVRSRPAPVPSLERPRLGEALPALYHYAIRVQLTHYYIETIVPAQHEIEAAHRALTDNETLRERAIDVGSVEATGVDTNGRLGEYTVTIRVAEDGAVAIPP